jgi:hypothetical protein
VIPSRQQKTQSSLLAVSSLVISLFAAVAFWRWLFPYLFEGLAQTWWLAVAIIGLAGEVASWLLLLFGLMYVFDFLTFPIQAHFSVEAAILRLKGVQMGRFRHVIKVSVEKEFVPFKDQQSEMVMTIAATKKSLGNALRPILKVASEDIQG